MSNNYYSLFIPDCYLLSNQVYNEEDIVTNFLKCDIIGLCVYKDECLTFLIKLEDGEVFSYIPIHSVFWKPIDNSDNRIDLTNLVYVNCPDYDIKINYIDYLNVELSCYLKNLDKWLSGRYVCTIDFYNDNELLNLLKLDNGNFALLPFHKLKFKSLKDINRCFNNYKKQRLTYKV